MGRVTELLPAAISKCAVLGLIELGVLMKILLVEDDADLAQRLARSLRREAFTVDLADGGEEALFLGRTAPYVCAVLDLGLPDIDGITVLRQWRGERDGFSGHHPDGP